MSRLAVSNIAWTDKEEKSVAQKLQQLGVTAVEIAPTKRWDDPTKATQDEIYEYMKWWAQFDIEIVAFQSMLFARPDLKLFEDSSNRQDMEEYMESFLRLAGDMGAKRLVFGSPKNRQLGNMSMAEADDIAVQFFARLGSIASQHGVILCLEPNAPQYNCNYLTTAAEGAELVRRVNSSGFGLHLDSACMFLAGDQITISIKENADILRHFHVSAPMLGHVYDGGDVDYRAASNALRDINYREVVSIEMRPGEAGDNVRRVEEAVIFMQSILSID